MRSLPEELALGLSEMFSKISGTSETVRSARELSGGSINTACVFTLSSDRNYFVKYNFNDRYPGMFDAESKGLWLLRNTGTVRIPQVIGNGVTGEYAFLVMEMIEQGRQGSDFFESLGREVACLHKVSDDEFGLNHDNYIGSLHQPNDKHTGFATFFSEMRLMPLAQKACSSGSLPMHYLKLIENICARLDELIPTEQPALLHGDLWGGNRIPGPDGQPWLIDPAAYFGHRETDIAMTTLFGGFDHDFYEAYEEVYAMQPGWKDRLDLHNLYPLLVHLNLFGSGYLPQIEQILRRYS